MTSVKTTSFNEWLISHVAPHHCFGCGKEGYVVCDGCVMTMSETDALLHCYRCEQPTARGAVCQRCRVHSPVADIFVAGEYEGLLERTIYAYKFERLRAAQQPLGNLLIEALPHLLQEPLLVPIPTAARHVRMRGYDHIELLTRYIAAQRNLDYVKVLQRAHQRRQLGASRAVRLHQAKTAFQLARSTDIKGTTIVLVDDVSTTGATLHAAATLLRQAGAAHIYGLVIAQQGL